MKNTPFLISLTFLFPYHNALPFNTFARCFYFYGRPWLIYKLYKRRYFLLFSFSSRAFTPSSSTVVIDTMFSGVLMHQRGVISSSVYYTLRGTGQLSLWLHYIVFVHCRWRYP